MTSQYPEKLSQFQIVTTPHKTALSMPGTPLLDSSGGNRKRSDIDFEAFSESKRRKSEKGGKGLRHFSMKVRRQL